MPVRWSSTFEFLSIALKMKNAIKEMWISDDDLGVYSFDKHGWNRIELVATFLKVIASLIQEFNDVTSFVSQSSSPTISHVFSLYNLLIDNVDDFITALEAKNYDQNRTFIKAANACLHKLQKYYSKTDENALYVPAISNLLLIFSS